MIRTLLHVGMTVPELEIGKAFYELFGLQSRVVGNDLVFRCEGRAQDQIRLMQGAKKKLSYTAFGTDASGMQVLLARTITRGDEQRTNLPWRSTRQGTTDVSAKGLAMSARSRSGPVHAALATSSSSLPTWSVRWRSTPRCWA